MFSILDFVHAKQLSLGEPVYSFEIYGIVFWALELFYLIEKKIYDIDSLDQKNSISNTSIWKYINKINFNSVLYNVFKIL